MLGTMIFSPDTTLRERIRSNLSGFDARLQPDTPLRRASVAATIIDTDSGGDAAVILTRRSSRLRNHGGQWALPGGRIDAGESAEQAAVRELGEEVGVFVDADAVLGRMDDYITRSGFCISSFVVWAGPGQELTINPDEVEFAVRLPLNDLALNDNPRLDTIKESEKPVLSLFMDSLGHEVYAPTAAVLLQLRDVALNGVHTRIDGYEQPLFAWK